MPSSELNSKATDVDHRDLPNGALLLATLVEVVNGEFRFSVPGLNETISPAIALIPLAAEQLGQTFVLGFDGGDLQRPIVLGTVHELDHTGIAVPLVIQSDREVRLQCGSATVKLTSDGTVSIRGQNVASRAAHTNRIRGGNVQIN